MQYKKSINLFITIFFVVSMVINANASITKNFKRKNCSEAVDHEVFPKGGRYAKVGNNRIYYRLLGQGKPTVIFSSGTGFPADGWFVSGIAIKIAKKTQVFAYDRTYTFKSCQRAKETTAITAQDVVKQLHQLLQKEKILPTYILVGHSFGGLYMLLYAKEFPREIKGLVFNGCKLRR